jgi:hypothetical protein
LPLALAIGLAVVKERERLRPSHDFRMGRLPAARSPGFPWGNFLLAIKPNYRNNDLIG